MKPEAAYMRLHETLKMTDINWQKLGGGSHNPEVVGSSPAAAPRKAADFVRKSAVF